MTITLADNTLKIQISITDLETLDETGRIEASLCFPNGSSVQYSLNTDRNKHISATFYDREIKTFVPEKIVSKWLFTDALNFKEEIDLPNQKKLSILLEKNNTLPTDIQETSQIAVVSSDEQAK